MRSLSLLLLVAIIGLLDVLHAQPDAYDYIDPHGDRQYVRIRSVDGNRYLYQENGNGTVKFMEDMDIRDLRSHWYIAETDVTARLRIVNRETGHTMHVEGQTGKLQIGTLPDNYWSNRWVFEPGTDFFYIRSAWQATQYMTTAVTTNSELTYAPQNTSDTAQHFIIEALPHGAIMPWTEYDETNYDTLTAPAHVVSVSYTAGSFDQSSYAAEAEKQGCILLNDFGSYVEWTVIEPADALTIRYSIADENSGTITLNITPIGGGPIISQKIDVDSTQSWEYIDNGTIYNSPGTGRIACKRYDEARLLLTTPLAAGDKIAIERASGDEMVWIDLVEAETTTTYTPATPSDYYYVTDAPWNAAGDGVTNDTTAIKNCISAATAAGKKVYFPAGKYNLHEGLTLTSNTVLQGAGIWHTELLFSQVNTYNTGGINGDGSNIQLHDFYMHGAQTTRSGGYKAIRGTWGTGSIIRNLWVADMEVGAWIDDFDPPFTPTDGLLVYNCRMRDNFADGINLSSGTVNSVIDNCHFRGNGDDAIATWAAGFQDSKGTTASNRIRYNTVECNYRAAGIGVFGGVGHRIHNNLVRDSFSGSGIRLNSVFVEDGSGTQIGYPFGTTDTMEVYENTLINTGSLGYFGTQLGAIDLDTRYADLTHINFRNIVIDGTIYAGVRCNGQYNASATYSYSNISFTNMLIQNAPVGSRSSGVAQGSVDYSAVISYSVTEFDNSSGATFTFNVIPTPITLTASGGGYAVTEGGTSDTYTIALDSQPTDDVTVRIIANAQVSANPNTLTFTDTDWSTPQTVTITAIDDPWQEGNHEGLIDHITTSNDATFHSLPVPIIHVPIIDNDVNNPPTIVIHTPDNAAIPATTGILLETTVTDDGLPTPPAAHTTQWSVVNSPNGSSVTFDDPASANTGVTFDTLGQYTLRLTADDGEENAYAEITINYGATGTDNTLTAADIGSPSLPGSTNENNGIWTINGSGADIWGESDSFHFASLPLTGDITYTIRILSQTNTHAWAKAGLMLRNSLDANSRYTGIFVTPGNGIVHQTRTTTGGTSSDVQLGAFSFPLWLRVVRSGSTITTYYSSDGINWTTAASSSPGMTGDDFIGLALCSHDNGVLGTATFDSLSNDLGNVGVLADAGADDFMLVDTPYTLNGSANDDGNPDPPGTITTFWTQISGPDTATITNPSNLSTDVSSPTPGEYTFRLSADDGELITFSDISLTIRSHLSNWQTTHFGSDTHPDAQLLADPDQDYLLNIEEYAFATNPNIPQSITTHLPSHALPDIGGKHLELTFRRVAGTGTGTTESGYTINGITYTVQVTDGLNPPDWQTGAALIQQTGTPNSNGDGSETVTVRLNEPASPTTPQRVMRLKIEVN